MLPTGVKLQSAIRSARPISGFLKPVPEEYGGTEHNERHNRVPNKLIELAECGTHADDNHGNDEQKLNEELDGRRILVMHHEPPSVV